MLTRRNLPRLRFQDRMRQWSRLAQIAAVILVELVALLLVYGLVALI